MQDGISSRHACAIKNEIEANMPRWLAQIQMALFTTILENVAGL